MGLSSAKKKGGGGRRFKETEYEGELFDFSVFEKRKTLRMAALLEERAPPFWENDTKTMYLALSRHSRSRENDAKDGSDDGNDDDDDDDDDGGGVRKRGGADDAVDAPSSRFLAHYHRGALASALIQEEVRQAEEMVIRMASRGLLHLITVDHTHAHVHHQHQHQHQHQQEANHHDVELMLARSMLRPSLFVGSWLSLDKWDVTVPRWMRPVAYAGTAAGPEPFWRRLLLEQRAGLGGRYTDIYEKDERVDRAAKQMARTLHGRVAASRIRYEAVIGPVKEESERMMMDWEDSLSLVVERDLRRKNKGKVRKRRR